MALGVPPDVREIVLRVCARHDVLDACRHRDLGTVMAVLGSYGVTQGRLADLTGISQGRLSEYMTRKRTPRASSTFQSFADGVGMPAVAREALGLAPDRSPAASVGRQQPDRSAPEIGFLYPDTPAEAAGNLAWLWRVKSPGLDPRPAGRRNRM
jgi:transcriptional regulator with XRE-family HTH domain